MKTPQFFASAVALTLFGTTTQAAVVGISGTFVPAIDGVNSFQSAAGAPAFSSPTATTGLWHDRVGTFDLLSLPSPLSGAYQGQALTSNEVVTTLTGLTAGAEYNIDIIHGIKAGIGTGEQDIDAGFASGSLTTYLEVNGIVTGEALGASGWEAVEQSIGTAFADASGELRVYINYASSTAAERSVYNGLAYTVLPSSGNAYCFGDGTGSSCPCSAFGAAGEGCANTGGTGAVMTAVGAASFGNDTFALNIVGVPGDKPGLILRGDNMAAIPAGDGILCTTGGSMRSHVQVTVAGSTTFTDFNGAGFGSVANAGAPTNFQFWYRDPSNVCTGAGFNFTNGWTVTYTP